ncbi:MAG TPA: metallophosphoesterase, partial [Polyangia bacterium]|nr:metallophosphoesterase [Polyangia bacterium]
GHADTEPEDTDDAPAAHPAAPTEAAGLERAFQAEPDPQKRLLMIAKLASLPNATEILTRVVANDSSDDVALAAAYVLRRAAVGNVVTLLDRRLGSGQRTDDQRTRMLREIERHQVFAAGQNLPRYLREAPPVFTVKSPGARHVRVLAFGDFGDGSPRQARIAEAMRRFHARTPFDLAVTVGDNFYPAGMPSPTDARWSAEFGRLYEPMRVPFFPTLGNHDWVLADSPVSEIAHSESSRLWRMPADRYTFVAGPIQFFAIDTNLISHAQLEWLDRELGRSTAPWKIVYGHHPIYTYGAHRDETALQDVLLPILRNRANVYLCGHDHDLQHIQAEDGVNFVLAGGGGALPRPVAPGPRALFAASRNGFVVIDASPADLTVTYVGEDLATLHRFTVHASGDSRSRGRDIPTAPK